MEYEQDNPPISFDEAKQMLEDGYVYDGYVLKNWIGENVRESLDNVGLSEADFSEEQFTFIWDMASKNRPIEPLLNPEFSKTQMVLIADVVEDMVQSKERWNNERLKPFIDHVMTEKEAIQVRKRLHEKQERPSVLFKLKEKKEACAKKSTRQNSHQCRTKHEL